MSDESTIGTVYDYNSKGPWGRILLQVGSFAWFHEELSFIGNEQIGEGEVVEFKLRYQGKSKFWQASSIRRRADVDVAEEQRYELDVPDPSTEPKKAERAIQVNEVDQGSDEPVMRAATGVVRQFNPDRGFGIIVEDDGGREVFVHQSRIIGEGFRYLLPGEPVAFDVERNEAKNRLEAGNVRLPAGRVRGTVKRFDHAKGFGFITPEDGGPSVFFHHSDIPAYTKTSRLTAEEDESVQFEIRTREDGRTQAIRVKRADSRPPLLRFAEMGHEKDWLGQLAQKAEGEPWQHGVNPNQYTQWPILKSYVSYTFARLEQEDRSSVGTKIAVGREGSRPYACFNTGLVTPNQEEIFALFVGKDATKDGRRWRLAGFHAASDHEMLGKFERLPVLAYYFDDPTVLLYGRRCELYIDIDHVVEDNILRFPRGLKENKHLARQALIAARAQTQQRVYRNYKTAVPQFYRGAVQLLLPLCLDSVKRR